MLRTATILLCLTCALPAAAQRDSTARTIAIESVDISGRRPMKEIGVQRTELDTLVLRENITASLADALATGSTIFIKSYGRATLATASFRGTAPSHTQVTWNDMKVNSPMLGQVDFSLIPAYFIDDATIYHGASSVGVTGGGLGGAVTLATKAPAEQGLGLRYVQGIGSFATFDEFLHLTYGGARWSSSTRVLYSTSDNDFRFRNYNSKEFVTDDDGQIVGEYYPLQRNRNGGFRDLHVMQELYYTTRGGDRFSLAAWYLDSHRGLARISGRSRGFLLRRADAAGAGDRLCPVRTRRKARTRGPLRTQDRQLGRLRLLLLAAPRRRAAADVGIHTTLFSRAGRIRRAFRRSHGVGQFRR